MHKTETVRARIDPDLKNAAEKILHKVGLNTTDAIRLFFKQITLNKGLPFDIKIPNEETIKAMDEVISGKQLKSYNSFADLRSELED